MAEQSSSLNLEAGAIAPLPDLFSSGAQEGGRSMTDLFSSAPTSITDVPQDPAAAGMNGTPEVISTEVKPPVKARGAAASKKGKTDAAAAKTKVSAEKTISSSKCQVAGCEVDLADQSRYNRRYRICDTHRKALVIINNGQEVRFCQQHARLEPVEKFTGSKRSCQASLDLHNKRQSAGANAAVAAGYISAPKCQVPGCDEDLLKQSVYHQRYKICPVHRKAFSIDINGELFRFCQQSARLMPLANFDGKKRSCRDKLKLINQRREELKNSLEERVNNPELPPVAKAFCQVPGCNPDPKDMKVYHLRNKVCPMHLAMLEVDIEGTMMRFCRQSARFLPLSEFDGTKRSCRKLLDRHNEKRRNATKEARALADEEASKAASEKKKSKGGKRGKPGPKKALNPLCQVTGCGAELKDLKPYNIRYKVCGVCISAQEVVIDGRKMRFCQQSARFMPLEDFDGLKRNCRQKLQKHNERGRVAYQKTRAKKPKDDPKEDPKPDASDAKA